MITDTSNTPLSDFEFQMKIMKRQYDEARHYYNQRKSRVSMMLDSWVRNRESVNGFIKNINKLEKILWEKLNMGTSIHVIFEQIEKIYKEMGE